MLSYYLDHFCTLKLELDTQKIMENTEDLSQSLAWRKTLRPCERDMIDTCPTEYPDDEMTRLCHSYQSVIIGTGIEYIRI